MRCPRENVWLIVCRRMSGYAQNRTMRATTCPSEFSGLVLSASVAKSAFAAPGQIRDDIGEATFGHG